MKELFFALGVLVALVIVGKCSAQCPECAARQGRGGSSLYPCDCPGDCNCKRYYGENTARYECTMPDRCVRFKAGYGPDPNGNYPIVCEAGRPRRHVGPVRRLIQRFGQRRGR